MRELPWGIVNVHDRAAVKKLVDARIRDGEHVREDVGLRGEKASVDTERGVAVSDQDKIAIVEAKFGMLLDTRKVPRQGFSWGSNNIEPRTLEWVSLGACSIV